MSVGRWIESALVAGGCAGLRALPWRRSLSVGTALGALTGTLGVRRRVAEANLAHAFPERTADERARILAASYREMGRVIAEFAAMDVLAAAPQGEVVAEAHGLDHLLALRGQGAVLMTGHYGSFELFGALLARWNPINVVARTLSNPRVEAFVRAQRERTGMKVITVERGGARTIYERLRAGEWVAMLGDQDGGRHGVFVPFLGRPASTMIGPARFALKAGVPMLVGFLSRCADGRHLIEVEPPLEPRDRAAPDAAAELTAMHVEVLERYVRRRPESWFWLHRRWKTQPPRPERETAADAPASASPADAPLERKGGG